MDEKMEIRLVNPTEDGFLQKIDWNKAELEENVRSIVAAYQGLVYTEDTVSDAKNDRAALRKLLNEIEDRRKLVKKKCMEPYEVFESDLKDVTALIKEQISIIDGQVKEYENSVKEEKKARLQDVYTEAIGELADRYSLEELRMQAYSNASEACEKTIYAGIDVEISTGTEHFSLTEKDQINLFGKKMQLLAGTEKLEYHEDGQPCKYFSASDMQNIVDRAMFFVSYNTTYCNAMNMWIKSAEKASDLEQITWGAEIPEEFQNEVLKDYMKILASGGIA